MLKIRLQRTGKRGQAYFKVVITEHARKPQGKYLELLGSYDPHKKEMSVEGERVKYWISQGAHMSGTVNNLLVGRSVIEGEKVKVWKLKPQKHGMEPEVQKKETPVVETQKAEENTEKKIEESQVAEVPEEERKAGEPATTTPETPIQANP